VEDEMVLENFDPLRSVPKAAQWCLLVVVSIAVTALLKWARLPAALLLGPMIAGILMESCGGRIKVPALPYSFAQAVIGCLVARAMTSGILVSFLHQWPLFLGVMLAVIAASSLLGFAISKLRILPDTTAVWGLLPGAASVMMLTAEAFGADARLVAFMQYLRVVMVAIVASLVARFWMHVTGSAPAPIWFPEIHWLPFAETLAVVLAGIFLGPLSRIPGGTILLPLALGTVLHLSNVIEIELPTWFLAVSYLLLGWTIGLRFTREILLRAFRALPQTVLSILVLLAFCGLLAWLLVRLLGVDPVTAYLATSPGGMDSAAIIAASTKVDLPFVMAQQTVRFLMVLVVGPPLSRWVARKIQPQTGAP
jgi:uncharacterized protein